VSLNGTLLVLAAALKWHGVAATAAMLFFFMDILWAKKQTQNLKVTILL
jgi:hypothetical protein